MTVAALGRSSNRAISPENKIYKIIIQEEENCEQQQEMVSNIATTLADWPSLLSA